MITEQLQDLAIRCALGELTPVEQQEFCARVHANPELRDFLHSLQKTLSCLARAEAFAKPPPALKQKVLAQLRSRTSANVGAAAGVEPSAVPALRFLTGSDTDWKPLPVPGAFIKLLSLQADRGYAVLLGKLDPGVRYPAHLNAGPEDFYILTGDLCVGDQVLRAGDFHHADAGSLHTENYSTEGCTLLAVLTTDDPLVKFAMA
jgi:anti-sigma factor ChrR (cupin superfamily)